MPADDRELLERCMLFEDDLVREAAERVEAFDGGEAFLSPGIPLAWDANWLLVEDTAMAAAESAAAADRVLGGLGMEHRLVGFRSPDHGRRLIDGFEALGWKHQRDLYMVLRRGPNRTAEAPVEELHHANLEQLRRELIRTDPYFAPHMARNPAMIAQVIEWERRMTGPGGDRWFAARHEGGLASACCLYQRDGIGQVEDVATLEDARRNGLARAVVTAAAEASQRAGNEVTFLVADADDWPKEFYERVGFDPVDVVSSFERLPQ